MNKSEATVIAITALACMAPSMAINAIHQYQHTPGAMAYPLAGAAVLSVLLAGTSPFAMGASFKERRFGLFLVALFAFVVCASYNLASAVGAASASRSETTGARTADNTRAALLNGQLAQAERTRGALAAKAGEQTAEMVDKSLQALRQNVRWTRSKECVDATLDDSRTFCVDYAEKLAVRDAAAKVSELDASITDLKAKLLAATGASAGQPADPQAESVGAALALVGAHPETRKIGLGLNLWFALTIEVLGSLGPVVFAHVFRGAAPVQTREPIAPTAPKPRHVAEAPKAGPESDSEEQEPEPETAENADVFHGPMPPNVFQIRPRQDGENGVGGEPSVYDVDDGSPDGAPDGSPGLDGAVREWLGLYTTPDASGMLKAYDAWVSFSGAPCGAPFRDGAPRAFYQALKQALLVCERRRTKEGWVYHRIALVNHPQKAVE